MTEMIGKWVVLLGVIVAGIYGIVKIQQIESKVTQIARPARLFHPSTIESRFEPRSEWEVELSPFHDRFFYVVSQQPLYWLGRGMQVLVFVTQDQKYVVKFFQLNRLRTPSSRGFFRDLFAKETKEKQQSRIRHREEIFSSSKICFEELQDETGIVYVHLNRTRDKIKGVKLIDRYGQSHRIRGDHASFVVQKRADYVIPTLTKLVEAGQLEEAKSRIQQIFDLLLTLAQKGFVDGDDALVRNNNVGFTDDRAIYIDTGHLFRVDNLDILARMKYEFTVRLEPLESWLQVLYPELASFYVQQKEQVLAQLESTQEVA